MAADGWREWSCSGDTGRHASERRNDEDQNDLPMPGDSPACARM